LQRQAADDDEARRQRRHQEMHGARDEIASRQEADREARLRQYRVDAAHQASRFPLDSSSMPAVERASLDRSPHSTAFERQAQDALSLGAAQLRDETGRAEVIAELELIFPTASRVRIERALDAAIQIGGDRHEAALLLLEPDEV
jgi:hypothetical protein